MEAAAAAARARQRAAAAGAGCALEPGEAGEPPVCECGSPAVVSSGHGVEGLECSATGALLRGDAVYRGPVPEGQDAQGGPPQAFADEDRPPLLPTEGRYAAR